MYGSNYIMHFNQKYTNCIRPTLASERLMFMLVQFTYLDILVGFTMHFSISNLVFSLLFTFDGLSDLRVLIMLF